jgi:replication factor C small subunit
MNDIKNSLWVEKHRPDSLNGFVGNTYILEKVKNYIKNNDVPHLLFYGKAGTGKTSLSKIITENIDCDVLEINASDLSDIDHWI